MANNAVNISWQVYYIRKAQLKAANKQYSTVKNDYEMSFTQETEVIPCDDDPADLPSVTFTFIPINQLEQHAPNAMIGMLRDE